MAAYGRNLADVEPGDSFQVVHILFGSLRYRYEASGVRAGTRARCRERTPDRIRLELADGGTAEIDAAHASFVEVRPLSPDPRYPAALAAGGPRHHSTLS